MIPRSLPLGVLAVLLTALPAQAAEWSKPAAVRNGAKTIVRFRARIAGDFLVVEAAHAPGWHSYAMDNEQRAAEKRNGQASLGVEQGVHIEVDSGGKLVGPWYQSPPHDLSQPDIQWFTWGFDETATFAHRLERSGDGPVRLKIGGQICDGKSCRPIDLELTVPSSNDESQPEFSTDALVPVRTETTTDSPTPPSSRDSQP